MRHPSLPEAAEVGWDDQAHWHPHVLRWEELDLLARCAALDDPELPHPGPLVALFHRFTPVCRGDATLAYPLQEAAYGPLAFRGKALSEQIHRFDYADAGFTWKERAPRGWVLEQEVPASGARVADLYTTRCEQNPEFPFAAWNDTMEHAREQYGRALDATWLEANGRRASDLARKLARSGKGIGAAELADALEAAGCAVPGLLHGLRAAESPVSTLWLLELLLGEERGARVRAYGERQARPPRVVLRFEITFPGYPSRPMEQPDQTLRRVILALDRELRRAVDGDAELSGSGSAYTPARRTLLREYSRIGCRAINDADRAVRVIRAVLAQHGAPRDTVIQQVAPERRDIPLSEEPTGS